MNDEYPLNVGLSVPEVCALIKWHSAQARAVARRLGRAQMEMQARAFPVTGKNLKILHDSAKQQVDFHIARGKGLLSILPDRNKR